MPLLAEEKLSFDTAWHPFQLNPDLPPEGVDRRAYLEAKFGGPERAAAIVILAGVSGALHVAKLPPAIAALQTGLGISLLQAGFLLSLVQLAGMSAGVAFGVLADGLGLKRSMLVGLVLLAAASALGAMSTAVPPMAALPGRERTDTRNDRLFKAALTVVAGEVGAWAP